MSSESLLSTTRAAALERMVKQRMQAEGAAVNTNRRTDWFDRVTYAFVAAGLLFAVVFAALTSPSASVAGQWVETAGTHLVATFLG